MLEKMGWMKLFSLFQKADENLALHLNLSWDEGKVEADGVSLTINPELIAEMSGFPLSRDRLLRENNSLAIEL